MKFETLENSLLKEKLLTLVSAAGLRLFVLPKPEYKKVYAALAVNYGSIDSQFITADGRQMTVPEGIAHFLEHKMFEKPEGDVFQLFAKNGASANAYTTYNLTNYLFSCTTGFRDNLEILLNMVQEPYFTDASVQKEQGIIEQELRMYEDDPGHRVFMNLMQALYHVNPVRVDIGGTVESIRRITKEGLYDCHRTFYHPVNMALMVVGDVEAVLVASQVEANLGKRGYRQQKAVERLTPEEPPEVHQAVVHDELVISRPRLLLGFKDRTDCQGRELLKRELATSLVWRMVLGRSSPLYNQLYEEGLLDDRFSARYSSAPTYAFSVLGGETEHPEKLAEAIRAGLERVAGEGLREEDFLRCRRALIGQFLEAFNSLEFIANSFVSHYFRGTSLFDYISIMEELSLDDLNKRYMEHVYPGTTAMSILWPKGRRHV